MLNSMCRYPQQMKNTIFQKSQIQIQLVLLLSLFLWFLLLYSHFHPFIKGNTSIATSLKHEDLKPINTTADPCRGRYIYIYNLPTEFNHDFVRNCRTLHKWFDMCYFLSNNGFGPKLNCSTSSILQDSGSSWFNTNQFLLEVIFHNRMKQYECLTNDSSVASGLFVPFYAGLDVGRYLWSLSTSVRDSASLRLAEWLVKEPEWKRMWGRDHFLITGRISWDFQRLATNASEWGNRLLRLPEIRNMTVLGIESCFGPDFENDFSIPYPTYFHPSSDKDVYNWQEKVRGLRKRPYLFSFAGAARPDLPHIVRSQIMEQCREASNRTCKLMDCDPSGPNKCEDPVRLIELFGNSTFCLQPRGDSYTRRSIFDSILAGCIPVFFNKGSAYLQYQWYFPKNHTTYSVFITENDVRDRNVSIEKVLLGIPEVEVEAMRKEVIRLIPRVVYADPVSKLENIEDAFDIAVKGVLERVQSLREAGG